MEYQTAVVIGRWQLFHINHRALIATALKTADTVLVLVGSSNAARSVKNPFTWQERVDMIRACFDVTENRRLVFEPIQDHYYSDSLWVTQVQRAVETHYEDNATTCIVGAYSDDSSYYLKYFPQWDFVPYAGHSATHATEIRAMLFNENCGSTDYAPFIPNEMALWLENNFVGTPEHKSLTEEARYIEQYKLQWANAPFPVTFVTCDAVVLQQGHVLVVKRKFSPGKGLWALPGGFIKQSETLLNGAIRELKEETRIKVADPILRSSLVDQHVFDFPKRSLRGRTITHAFCFRLKGQDLPEVKAADDAEGAFWIPFSEVYAKEYNFFEDHAQIIQRFIMRGE